MKNWMDKLEQAAFRLRDRCSEAVRKAPENFEKAKPVIQQNIDKVRSEVGDAFEKAAPAVREGLDKMADTAKSAYEKAKPAIESGLEKLSNAVEKAADDLKKDDAQKDDAPDASEPVLSPEEQLEAEVDDQVEKIRAAKITPTSISDFIAQKYGKKDD